MPRSHYEMGEDRSEVGGAGATESTTAASSTSSTSAAAAASPGGSKRGRDPDDEVYLDNFHSHKRFHSEIMASSLNGLSVGDSLAPVNLAESAARSESACDLRDELASQYSPMSEDSDDCRCGGNLSSTTTVPQFDSMSPPTSPPNTYHTAGPAHSDGRWPSSPTDMCHATDLRRAALLRSVQMRTQPHCPAAYELSFSSGQENLQSAEEGEDRPFSGGKGLDDEAGYQSTENEAEFIVKEDSKHFQKHD